MVFDECHKAKNLKEDKLYGEEEDTPKGSKIARAIIDLQKIFRNARILYSSATAVTETVHFRYMVRLGIFGDGTNFETFKKFQCEMKKRYSLPNTFF